MLDERARELVHELTGRETPAHRVHTYSIDEAAQERWNETKDAGARPRSAT